MTLEELELKLPNGFHDVLLTSITRSYSDGTCVLDLQVDDESETGEEVLLTFKVLLTGLSFMVMEAPDANRRFGEVGAERISGFETTERYLSSLEALRVKTPPGSFFYSFFMDDLNCSLHVAATDAKLV
jgi:hypothetical protein